MRSDGRLSASELAEDDSRPLARVQGAVPTGKIDPHFAAHDG